LCVYGNLDTLENGGIATLEESGDLLSGAGAAQAKGPIVAWMNTIDAYKKLGRELPLNVKLVVDTTGVAASEALASSDKVKEYLANISYVCVAGGTVISDVPSIIYACRGVEHYTFSCKSGAEGNTPSGSAGALTEAMTCVAAKMGELSALDFGRSNYPEKELLDVTFSVDQFSGDRQIGKVEGAPNAEDMLACLWHESQLSIHGVTTSAPEYNPANIGTYTIPASATLQFSVRTANQSPPPPLNWCHETIAAQIGSEGELSCDKTVRPFRAVTTGGPLPDHYAWAQEALKEVSGEEVEYIQTGDTIAAASILEDMTGKTPLIWPVSGCTGPDGLPKKTYMNSIKAQGLYLEMVLQEREDMSSIEEY